MTQRLIKRLSALGQYEEAVAALNAAALERPAALKNKQASGQRSDILSVCDDAFVLAQQLTHIELVGRCPCCCFYWASDWFYASKLSGFIVLGGFKSQKDSFTNFTELLLNSLCGRLSTAARSVVPHQRFHMGTFWTFRLNPDNFLL